MFARSGQGSHLVDAAAVADEQVVGDIGPQLDMPGAALEEHAGPGDMHGAAHVVVAEGGRHEGHRVCAVDDAQGGPHQGVEGALELVVAHPRAAKRDAAHIGVGVLDGSPRSPCNSKLQSRKAASDFHYCTCQCRLCLDCSADRTKAKPSHSLAQHRDMYVMTNVDE